MHYQVHSPDRSSPIRKMLAKKLVSYYDRLERSKSRGKKKPKPDIMLPTNHLKSKKQTIYEEETHQKKKFNRLQDLIRDEYRRTVAASGGISPEEIFSSPENMSKTQQLNTSVEVVLAQRAIHAELNPESDPEPSESEEKKYDRQDDDVFDEKLYHLNTRRDYLHNTPFDKEAYDFHQRKSKEIRRLQYVAQLRSPKKRPKRKKKVVKKKIKKTPKKEIPKQEDKRLKEEYPVWVVDKNTGIPHPAVMTCDNGFKINPADDLLEIREGDKVNVELVYPENGKKFDHGVPEFFTGITRKRLPHDGDCDFTVEDPNLFRHPIQINFRYEPKDDGGNGEDDIQKPKEDENKVVEPEIEEKNPIQEDDKDKDNKKNDDNLPKRSVLGTNCKLYNPDDDFLGRARLDIDGDKYVKAMLVENGNIFYLLLSRISDDEVKLKGSNLKKYKEKILIEEIQKIYSKDGEKAADLHILTLKDGYDDHKVPRQIYYLDGPQFIDQSILLNDEIGIAVCENDTDYIGTVEVVPDEPWSKGFKLILPDFSKNGNLGYVTVVLDDNLKGRDNFDGFVKLVKEAAKNKIEGPKIFDLPESLKKLLRPVVDVKHYGTGTNPVRTKEQGFGPMESKKKSKNLSTKGSLYQTAERGIQTSESLLDLHNMGIDQKIEFGIEDYNGSNLHVTVRQKSPEKAVKVEGEDVPIYSNFTVSSIPKDQNYYSRDQTYNTPSGYSSLSKKKRRSKKERRESRRNITAYVEAYNSKLFNEEYGGNNTVESSLRVSEMIHSSTKNSKKMKKPPRTPTKETSHFSHHHQRIFRNLDVSPRSFGNSNLIKYLRYIENRVNIFFINFF